MSWKSHSAGTIPMMTMLPIPYFKNSEIMAGEISIYFAIS